MSAKIYDESSIQTLSSLEHIRKRSGMYIGRLGDGSHRDDGIYVLLKEVIDNAIDEFIMGHGTQITVNRQGTLLSVRDYGRGIPLGKVVDCVSVINTGAKYNDDVFQFSVGLNGVGTKAVNALSQHFLVRSVREGQFAEAVFSRGALLHQTNGPSRELPGVYVEFIPDEDIFGAYHFRDDFLEERFFNYAALNMGLELVFGEKKFKAEYGLKDLLLRHMGEEEFLYEPYHYRDSKMELSFVHTHHTGEVYFSFVNGQFTSDGGTHQSGLKEGFLRGANQFFNKNFSGADVREGLVAFLAIKVREPIFESQTKNKLGNTELRTEVLQNVKELVADALYKNKSLATALEEKILFNEKLRKELTAVQKEAREKAKKISYKIPNLRDCKFHFGEDEKDGEGTMIFITEGQSASGSIVASRDVYRQAIFSLRGKPQNLWGRPRSEIYKSEELYNMMMALGIENEMDKLRYEKIILATDADHDGFHIRNLLLSFFFAYFLPLVLHGHLYILETPLFRVRNTRETLYCYSEAEKQKALEKLKTPEITRFKGLGEISPMEFGRFIQKDTIRLIPVFWTSSQHHVRELMEFYMGKNTPQRRQFIMDNLIYDLG